MNLRINQLIRKYSEPCMWAAGVCTAAALVLQRVTLPGSPAAVLFYAAVLLAGIPIFVRAVQGLRYRTIGIELLVTIAVAGACSIGELSEAAIVTFLFQVGSYLEQKTMKKTRSAIRELTRMAPKKAWRLNGGEPEEIDADEVETGDLLLVKTGGQIAADGVVLHGEGYVTEAGITGESQPVKKRPGDPLYAGTFLDSGTLRMEASRVGEDTTFAKIIALVEEAQDAKSPEERFIDRFAAYYTPAVVVIAALVLLLTRSVDTAITVLVLACPGALVIGAPIANVAGIGRGAREGILLKGGDSIHTYAKTDTVVFDKTGTLTRGTPEVIRVTGYSGDTRQLLAMAAAAEQQIDHPLAKAIVRYEGPAATEAFDLVNPIKGMGVEATGEDRSLLIGNLRLMEARGVVVSAEARREAELLQARSATVVFAAFNGELALLMAIADAPRENAAESIRKLKSMGIRHVVMLTGDNEQTAASMAELLGITEYAGGLLPQDKLERVRAMQQKGQTVTFVGDGINDSPALTAADTGIAVGSGTDVAIDCSDVVLIRSSPESLVRSLELSRKITAVLRQNIVIAVGTVFLLLIGLFAGFVHMAVGMLIHEASIFAVILNALRLLWKRGEKKL